MYHFSLGNGTPVLLTSNLSKGCRKAFIEQIGVHEKVKQGIPGHRCPPTQIRNCLLCSSSEGILCQLLKYNLCLFICCKQSFQSYLNNSHSSESLQCWTFRSKQSYKRLFSHDLPTLWYLYKYISIFFHNAMLYSSFWAYAPFTHVLSTTVSKLRYLLNTAPFNWPWTFYQK